MSKERELLKKIIDSHYYGSSQLINGLKFEIEELLAKPEQNPSTDDYMYNKLKEDYEYLLSHPPKREPLSSNKINEAFVWNKDKTVNNIDSFRAGVKYAEKAHGVGNL